MILEYFETFALVLRKVFLEQLLGSFAAAFLQFVNLFAGLRALSGSGNALETDPDDQ